MKLRQWLDIPGNSASRLAEQLGVSLSTITRAAEGVTIPSRKLMPRIVAATGGAVTANDFFGLDDDHDREAA